MVSFNNIIAITNNVIPILLSFYLGSWSDQFGRLPFLGLYMIGRTLSALANLLNAVYLEEWGKWVWLATVMPPLNLSGGISSYIIMLYSFIANNTSPRDRTFRQYFLSEIKKPIVSGLGDERNLLTFLLVYHLFLI